MRRTWGFLLLAYGCGREQPTKVRIVDDASGSGHYATRDVTLETIADLAHVQGGVAQAFGGALLDLDQDPQDRGAARPKVVLEANDVQAQWILDGDVAVPSDFDSLNLLSAYAHIEKAALFFESQGVATASERVPLYYQPRITTDVAEPEQSFPDSDNAAFFPNADALLLFRMVLLQDIPFPVNRGVMSHEYAHRVFYYEAWGGQMFAILIAAIDQQNFFNVWNLIRAVDEGCSDYWGAVLTSNPDFVVDSYGAADRDLEVLRVVDETWTDGSAPTIGGAYYLYALGSVLASTLWGFAAIAGTTAVSQAVLAAERELAGDLQQAFAYKVGDFEAYVIDALPTNQRQTLCDRAEASYAEVWDRFDGVCP